jgi:hypothetical protein
VRELGTPLQWFAEMVRIFRGEPFIRQYHVTFDARYWRADRDHRCRAGTIGLFTRAATFIMSGEMAVAYWYFANRPSRGFMPIVNGGTLEVLYCFVSFYLVFAGAGVRSLDAVWRKEP